MLTQAQRDMIARHAKDNPMPGTTGRQRVAGMPLHVDGDYLAYYCSGGDDVDRGQARRACVDRIECAMYSCGADRAIVHLSMPQCNKGLRYLVADMPTCKPYQAQRKAGKKPVNWAHLREWLESYEGHLFRTQKWLDREADDGIAWASEAAYALGRPAGVLTADKDFRMFAGLHLVWTTLQIVDVPPGTYDIQHGGKQYGHKWFWQQMLQGDTADNILGLQGVGEVAASKLLAGTTSNKEALAKVLSLYSAKLGDAALDHFAAHAALLWMRTDAKASPVDWLKLTDYPEEVKIAADRLIERLRTHRANPYQ